MKFSPKNIEKFQELIKNSETFLVLGHTKPDGDCAGSVLAWYNYLKGQGKKVQAYFSDTDASLDFLENYYEAITDYHDLNFSNLDCLITCDFNALHRSGIEHLLEKNVVNSKTKLINIDHHVGKAQWPDLVFSKVDASSTTIIIYNLFKEMGFDINSMVATCLLTGLLTDTNFLTNTGTNNDAFDAYNELLNLGAKEKVIIQNLQEITVNIVQALGEVLADIKFNAEWGIAVARITDKLLEKYHLQEGDLGRLYDLLVKIKEYKAILVLKDRDGGQLIKGSWRTREDIDLGKLARFMGGGGHEKAAGFAVQNYKI